MAEKRKISELPEATNLEGFYALGYKVGQSVKVAIETLRGNKGDTGLQGLKGDKGDTGSQGIQGAKGDKGDTGSQGIQGVKGDKGDTGTQGIQGAKGDKGDTGSQGIQGEKGDQGDTGLQGIQGIQGEKGDQGDTGAQGIQGIQGLKGEKGDQGEQGDKGDIGMSFRIVSHFDSLSGLEAAYPDGSLVDGVFEIGAFQPYSYFYWDSMNNTYSNAGQLQGAKGDAGQQGAKGDAFVYSDFTAGQLDALKGKDADLESDPVNFVEPQTRENLNTGDTVSVSFGKIRKWFDWLKDLGTLAWKNELSWSEITGKPNFSTVSTTGSYSDLTDKPIIPDGLPVFDLGAVYLSSKKGNDNNSGADYYHPVLTFNEAVEQARTRGVKNIQIIDSETYTLDEPVDVTGLEINGSQATIVGQLNVTSQTSQPTIINLYSHQSSADGQTENYLLNLDSQSWENEIQYNVNYVYNKGTLSGAIMHKAQLCRAFVTINVNLCVSSLEADSVKSNIFFLDESISYPTVTMFVDKISINNGSYQNVIRHKGSDSRIHANITKIWMNKDFPAIEVDSSEAYVTANIHICEGPCSLYKYSDPRPTNRTKINCHLVKCASTAQSPYPVLLNLGIDSKVDKEAGKELYPTADKTKLAGIEANAQKNPTFKTINGETITGSGDIVVQSAPVINGVVTGLDHTGENKSYKIQTLSDSEYEAISVSNRDTLYFISETPGDISRIVFGKSTYKWTTKSTTLSYALTNAAYGVVNGKIYILGGNYGGSTLNTIYCYDPVAETITQKANLATSMGWSQGFAVGTDVYICGGAGNNGTNKYAVIYKYDTIANTATQTVNMPAYIDGACGIASGGKGYIIDKATKALYCYNPASPGWTTLTSMPIVPGDYPAMEEDNGYLYVFGGLNAGQKAYKYNIATNVWSAIADLPSGFVNQMRAFKLGRNIFLCGGNNGAKTVYTYNLDNNSYNKKLDMNIARFNCCAVAVSGKGYILAGGVTSIEVYQPEN